MRIAHQGTQAVCTIVQLARLLLPAWVAGMATPVWADSASRWPKLEEVIVVSKTHFDIGFTDLASRVVDRYRTSMADQALKLVDESRGLPPDQQFSWTLAGWPMAQILWPGQTAERRERFLAAMRAGRLVPHALAFTTHTESLDLEDLTRGFRFSVEMARLAGQPLPTGCKMTDVPDHTRGLATVLANAGVKFFHLGCNDNCSPADVPQLYWWEGPDGSRVLTMFSPTYGSDLCPPAGWPHKTWLCMWMTDDNHGPPNTKMVEALFARAKRDLPGVRVRFGQMSDFADAMLREKPDLPVVRRTRRTPGFTASARCRSRPSWRMPPGRGSPRWSRSTRCWRRGACRPNRSPRLSARPTRTRCSSASTPGDPTSARYAGYSYGDAVEEESRRRRLSFPPGGIRTEAGLCAQCGRAGRAGHRQADGRAGRGGQRSRPPHRRLQSASLDPRRRNRSALDRPTAKLDRRRQPRKPSPPSGDKRTSAVRGQEPAAAGLPNVCALPAETPRGSVSADAKHSASRTSSSA